MAGKKIITISGKKLPPPPRKVVIERLAPLPSRPQPVIVERWLPYGPLKRKVIFKNADTSQVIIEKPKNIIVQWETPNVVIKKQVKYLGVIRADPDEYIKKFGDSLKKSKDLPQFVLDIKTPEHLKLAAEYENKSLYELEGQLEALRLIDLDREGLTEYKNQLQALGFDFFNSNYKNNV